MGNTNESGAEHRTQDKSIMAVNETKQVLPPLPVNFMPEKTNMLQPLWVTRFAKFY